MSYALGYRKRVIEYRQAGHTLEETARMFKVSIPTIRNWEKQLREKGTLEKKPLVRPFKKIDPDRLRQFIAENPGVRQIHIAKAFGCTGAAVRQAFKRLGITHKKGGRITRARPRKEEVSG